MLGGSGFSSTTSKPRAKMDLLANPQQHRNNTCDVSEPHGTMMHHVKSPKSPSLKKEKGHAKPHLKKHLLLLLCGRYSQSMVEHRQKHQLTKPNPLCWILQEFHPSSLISKSPKCSSTQSIAKTIKDVHASNLTPTQKHTSRTRPFAEGRTTEHRPSRTIRRRSATRGRSAGRSCISGGALDMFCITELCICLSIISIIMGFGAAPSSSSPGRNMFSARGREREG